MSDSTQFHPESHPDFCMPTPKNEEVAAARSILFASGYKYYWSVLHQCPGFRKKVEQEPELFIDVLEYDFSSLPGHPLLDAVRYEFAVQIDSNKATGATVDIRVFQFPPNALIKTLSNTERGLKAFAQVAQTMSWLEC